MLVSVKYHGPNLLSNVCDIKMMKRKMHDQISDDLRKQPERPGNIHETPRPRMTVSVISRHKSLNWLRPRLKDEDFRTLVLFAFYMNPIILADIATITYVMNTLFLT